MSDQGLGNSAMADDSDVFNPLIFLAQVAMQDAMQEASLQDTVVQEPDTQKPDTQAEQDAAVQQEGASGSADGFTGESVTRMSRDQLLSVVAGLCSTATEPSSPVAADSDDESDSSAKGEPNTKGKKTASRQTTAEDRLRETAAIAQDMAQRRAVEEEEVMEEMKQNEERDKLAAEDETGSASLDEIAATGIVPEDAVLMASLEDEDSDTNTEELIIVGAKRRLLHQPKDPGAEILPKQFSIFSALSNYLELFMELAKHLRINDLISLYAISKDFHETLNGHLSHILKAYAVYQAPESSRIFVFTLYRPLCTLDPVGRPDPTNPALVRMIPSLRWLCMVIHREKCVRDILACMAREGHRMPKTMPLSMKKMWLTMDIATSARRVQLIHNERYWTDYDLYNMQMLFVKLDMRSNDPIDGPGDDGLRKLMLGQRGLTPLCHLLKRTRYTDILEVLEAAVRYSYWPIPENQGLPIQGVPPHEIGRGHLEGWGLGQVHLYRIDELVMREPCQRYLQLDKHIVTMMIWGYVDSVTKKNIKVTKEEMYMSDDDDQGRKKTSVDGKGKKKKDVDRGKGKGKEREKSTTKDEKSRDGEGDTDMAG